MKTPILFGAIALLFLCTGCEKTLEALAEETLTETSGTDANGFTKYTIKSGQHYASGNDYKLVETDGLAFVVLFDSTAIYQSALKENQYDINKLYGFSDNEAQHHLFSARIGWRWSDGALRLFGYVYNNGTMISKEITTAAIGKEVRCSIKVAGAQYLFSVDGAEERLPRMSSTAKAKGYQLYPYFGGDEAAPHDVTIRIKNL